MLGFRFFDACYLEKIENGYFYDYSKSLNPWKTKIFKYLLDNKQISIYWINIKEGLKFAQIPIKIEEFSPNKVSISYNKLQ